MKNLRELPRGLKVALRAGEGGGPDPRRGLRAAIPCGKELYALRFGFSIAYAAFQPWPLALVLALFFPVSCHDPVARPAPTRRLNPNNPTGNKHGWAMVEGSEVCGREAER